jgi:hypothetical protein
MAAPEVDSVQERARIRTRHDELRAEHARIRARLAEIDVELAQLAKDILALPMPRIPKA